MNKMKRFSALLMAVILVIGLMGACTSGNDDSAEKTDNKSESSKSSETTTEDKKEDEKEEAAEPVTIKFLQWWGTEGAVGASLEGLVADFESQNPNITVEIISLPFGETKTQIVANHASGTIADVVGLNPPWTREFVDLGILEPLDAYMDGDADFNRDDYFPASMAKIKGNTYLAPYNTLSFFLYYNKDMFEEAGLDVPESWDDIVAAANTLTNPDANKYGFTLSLSEGGASNGSILSLYPLLYAANGRTFKDGKYTVQTDEMVEAMNMLKTLSEEGSIVPGENVKNDAMMVEEFSLGNIGMMIQNDAHVATIAQKNPDLNYGLIPIPSVDGSGTPELRHHGWDLGMTAKGKNKEAAWKFISFLMEKDNMVKAGIEMKKTPSMYGIPVAEDASEPEKLAKKYLAEYSMVEELMAMPSAGACWTELTKAGITVLNGSKTVEEALADCQKEWDSILGQ